MEKEKKNYNKLIEDIYDLNKLLPFVYLVSIIICIILTFYYFYLIFFN